MMNKHMSEYAHSQYSSFNWQNGGILKMIFPVPYSIIYEPEYIDWLIMNRKCQFHEKKTSALFALHEQVFSKMVEAQ